ncbi:MAG: hypothetical protein RID53_20670 [Coleofasciculus sp. B1-GNL1-01]|uniref:hypothetical protein n=1 Tax=Coleofasciculus sp. B1-GNL1-01 TaxID=3068484 RepID=UPI0032F439CF
MQLRNENYSKLPRFLHRYFPLQRIGAKRLAGSTLTQVLTLAIAVGLTNLGATLAQVPGNSTINSPTPQSFPSPRLPRRELNVEPVRPAPIPALYEHPDFFEEGHEDFEEKIDQLRLQNTPDSSEDEVLTIEESAYWENQDHGES